MVVNEYTISHAKLGIAMSDTAASWEKNIQVALDRAASEQRPILVDFFNPD